MAVSQVGTPKAGGVSPTGNYHKKFPIFSVLLLTILSVVSAICVYLFLQVRELSISQPVPSPSASPFVYIDPMSTWQEYLNPTFGFSFKYPKETFVLDSIERLGQRLIVQNVASKETTMDTPQMVIYLGPNNGRDLSWYSTNASKEYGTDLKTESLKIGGIDALLGQTGQKQKIVPTVWIINADLVYTIQLPATLSQEYELFTQILNTFTFSKSTVSYTCPTSGYVDCMPSPDGPKPSCAKEAMDWYKANCPDFKGAAL
jgi:hypothetical protein